MRLCVPAFRVPRSAFRVPIRRGTFFGKREAEAPGIVVFAIAIGPGCAGVGSSFSAIGIPVSAIGCTARAIRPVRTGNKVGGHASKSDGLGIRPGGQCSRSARIHGHRRGEGRGGRPAERDQGSGLCGVGCNTRIPIPQHQDQNHETTQISVAYYFCICLHGRR